MSEWGLVGALALLAGLASIFLVNPLRHHLKIFFILPPIIWGMAFIGYKYWGGFGELQQYVQRLDSQRQAQKMLQSIKSPQELITKLRAKLKEKPSSAKGWYLLGRLYSSQNEQQNAINSFTKAYQIKPNNEQYAVNFAHSLWIANHQQFNEEIIEILNRLLKNNPNQPDALAMHAMNAFAHQDYRGAIEYWQHLLDVVPAQSEEAHTIQKAIAKAQALIIN